MTKQTGTALKKKHAGNDVEALPPILGGVVEAIFSFFVKAVGFVAEHARALFLLD